MGTISLQSESDQNQPTVNADITPSLQETNPPTRASIAADVTKIGELLCGNWTSFIRWYRFEWTPFFGCSMDKLSIDQLHHLHAELIELEKHTHRNSALILTIRNHFLKKQAEHNAASQSMRYTKNLQNLASEVERRTGSRTAAIEKMADYELVMWINELGAAPAVIKSDYRSKTRIIAARKSDGSTWVDGSLALDPKVLPMFPNLRLVTPETNKTASILHFAPTLANSVPNISATPKLDPSTPLLLTSGKIENILLLPSRIESLATPDQRVKVQDTVKQVSSGVNWRVVIQERCAVDWNEYVTAPEAERVLAWATARLIEIPTDAGMTRRELKTKIQPGRLHDYCLAVSQGLAADTAHLTLDELNAVLALCGMPALGRKVEAPTEFASDKERWQFLNAHIFPLESGLKVDRMLCRANNGIPQTITRATRQQLEKYRALLIELATQGVQAKYTPPTPAQALGDGSKRRLGKKVA